jgi:hypothetical protein
LAKHKVSGTITVFTDLIVGIRTDKDMETWLLRYFTTLEKTPPRIRTTPEALIGPPPQQLSTGKLIPLPCLSVHFSDLFVVLAIAEDLECLTLRRPPALGYRQLTINIW